VRRVWLGWLGLVVVGTWLLWPRPAWACTPPPGGLPAYTATDRTMAAPIVLEGLVVSVSGVNYQTAVIQVTRYFKGIGPQLIAVSNYGPNSMCLSSVYLGQTGVFYITGDEAHGYAAFYLSQFDAVDPNEASLTDEVIKASGQDPRTDFTPYVMGTADAVMTQAFVQIATLRPTQAKRTPYPPPPTPTFAKIAKPYPPFPYPTFPAPTPRGWVSPQTQSQLDAINAFTLLGFGCVMGGMAGGLLGLGSGMWFSRRRSRSPHHADD